MNIEILIKLAKAEHKKFFVKDDSFIIELETGILIMINPLDDLLYGKMDKSQIEIMHQEVKKAVSAGEISTEILDKFENKYCK